METRPRVLVIDDEEPARYGIGRALANQNYEIEMAADGAGGLAKIASFQPDAVLSDINMPGMDGITLLRYVKEQPDPPPVILITAHGSEAIAIDALRAGAYNYIPKPFEIEELRVILRNAIDHRLLARQNREYYEKLERALADLRSSQAALVQAEKMASLGALVGGIAHEIHTPLGVIQSSADTLERAASHIAAESTSGPTERYKEAIGSSSGQLRRACARIQAIVGNLREFAQLDRSDVARVDIHTCVEAALRLLGGNLAGVTIDKRYGQLPPIACHPRDLNQLFMNLLLNALDATERSGRSGMIRIETRPAMLQEAPAVDVAISDNGPGIPPEQMEHLFDPAFKTMGGKIRVGFGLPICYRIVQSHGGSIEVRSEVGEGAVFVVTLPVDLPDGPVT